jgi:hypothetical protein
LGYGSTSDSEDEADATSSPKKEAPGTSAQDARGVAEKEEPAAAVKPNVDEGHPGKAGKEDVAGVPGEEGGEGEEEEEGGARSTTSHSNEDGGGAPAVHVESDGFNPSITKGSRWVTISPVSPQGSTCQVAISMLS